MVGRISHSIIDFDTYEMWERLIRYKGEEGGGYSHLIFVNTLPEFGKGKICGC